MVTAHPTMCTIVKRLSTPNRPALSVRCDQLARLVEKRRGSALIVGVLGQLLDGPERAIFPLGAQGEFEKAGEKLKR